MIGGNRISLLSESEAGLGCSWWVFLLPFFLQLLLKPKFSSVEKIKTIGSTYMAAAGLSVPSGHETQVLSYLVSWLGPTRGISIAPRPVTSKGAPSKPPYEGGAELMA